MSFLTESIEVPDESRSEVLLWLQEYAAERARLIAEGKGMQAAILDQQHWLAHDYGAAHFHFGSIQ